VFLYIVYFAPSDRCQRTRDRWSAQNALVVTNVSIGSFKYNKDTVSEISNWVYGTNWPAVYIIYNKTTAYVGETLDLARRTQQHLQEDNFKARNFTDICLISDLSFNKSVILDLESFLIKCMSADGTRKLINGNAGVSDHNYFYKSAYEEEFKGIWHDLVQRGIASRSIADIENSELFKYSPYKTLNKEQEKTAYEILQDLCDANNGAAKSMVEVKGGAGTGKTILAVYIIKLLKDISANKNVWDYADDDEVSYSLRGLADRLHGINRIGFVVPMVTLRTAMKAIFKSIDGLSEDMVLAPEEAALAQRFDLLVVDEAHRLYQRHHLPGLQLYAKFDRINEQILGAGHLQHNEDDPTELDWIIRNSRLQVIFYDPLQTIRTTDIDPNRFYRICRPHIIEYRWLISQMRCKGGNGYYEYVKAVLEKSGLSVKDYKSFADYRTHVVDDISVLFTKIKEANDRYGLCKVVCGPGWKMNEDIDIQGHTYRWASNKTKINDCSAVYSIHKSHGFDLNYAGVIFGREVYYDTEEKRVRVDKKNLKDSFMKSSGDEAMQRYVMHIYLTLMTRGIHGTYIYAVDDAMRDYLKEFFN